MVQILWLHTFPNIHVEMQVKFDIQICSQRKLYWLPVNKKGSSQNAKTTVGIATTSE